MEASGLTRAEYAAWRALTAALGHAIREQVSEDFPVEDTVLAVMARNPALPRTSKTLPVVPAIARTTTARPPLRGPLFDALLDPLSGPDLRKQLVDLVEQWNTLLSDDVRDLLWTAIDLLAEERVFRGEGPGPMEIPSLNLVGDPGYSIDEEWMPGLVLAVRHGRVWLHQLARWYGTQVDRLDQIPDAALEDIVRHGANGLWLVGIWERSLASKRIKQRRGNKEAAASAYSLVDYVVADDLGGQAALDALTERAARHGLRLCADVVPNHTGLDSRWMVEHPEWFVQTNEPPFPGYTFDGPDLSGDPRIGVFLEDGYWTESDAAVVFQRIDRQTGERRWIYHGNDGTRMPWNDTAQLDLTRQEVRAALIELVVGLAERFGALRFDAAMALAKRHVRRLWYPGQGEAGAIPSRAGTGFSEEEWDRLMPNEFWSELVQAVRKRAPNTLLLAEAFWMMEVDFVRDFGINRVYWSAFRDWIRDGKHSEHKAWLRATLAAEPTLLGHLCLFLSNPDEETCAEVFGTGDRYIAAATLQAAFPGLVLLAHGQVEGLAERYGMEFVKPQSDERPSHYQVERHNKWIEPLLQRRDMFGRAEGFRLFDVIDASGSVHDPVYAIAQKRGTDRALVLVNASPDTRWGTIRDAIPTRVGDTVGSTGLCEALGLEVGPDRFVALREHATGLWYVRSTLALRESGLGIGLGPWQTQLFFEFREIVDHDGYWADLATRLNGAGTYDFEVHDLEAGVVQRCATGVLLHATSLPGPEDTGTLGAEARDFVDWLADSGIDSWQVLPLCHPGPGNSPYSSPASRLGNPDLIDLRTLVDLGLIDTCEGDKMALLEQAANNVLDGNSWEFDAWVEAHPSLEPEVRFSVLKAANEGLPWWEWTEQEADPEAVRRGLAIAWIFDTQWADLARYALERGVELIGDLPIYVALDSADVWARPDLFELDETGRPTRISGVPPDAFAPKGQLWGNPLYAWERHADEGYAWWIERFRRAREWTPTLRVDHFRGFAAYYAVEHDAPDATDGTWESGPGVDLFHAIERALGPAPMIAEDLGTIDQPVHDLRKATGMLCTRVLQFGVGAGPGSPHRPDRIEQDTALYTGTHDNQTSRGWFDGLPEAQQQQVLRELGVERAEQVAAALIRLARQTPATRVIVPMQDLLGLDDDARMNVPGEAFGNWSWRLDDLPSAADAHPLV